MQVSLGASPSQYQPSDESIPSSMHDGLVKNFFAASHRPRSISVTTHDIKSLTVSIFQPTMAKLQHLYPSATFCFTLTYTGPCTDQKVWFTCLGASYLGKPWYLHLISFYQQKKKINVKILYIFHYQNNIISSINIIVTDIL